MERNNVSIVSFGQSLAKQASNQMVQPARDPMYTALESAVDLWRLKYRIGFEAAHDKAFKYVIW